MFEFFGLNEGNDDDLLQKFFLQEIDIWLLTQGETFFILTTLTQPFHMQGTIKMLKNFCLLPQETLRLRKTVLQFSKKKPPLQYCRDIVAGKAVITSAVAGGITLNPIVFASLTSFGLVVKAVASFKNTTRKL